MTRRPSQANAWLAYLGSRAETVRSPLLARFYRGRFPSPETPVGEVPLVAMDMETTGLEPQRHAIVSIGLVPFTLDRIRLAERKYWVVHPAGALEGESVTFHHITHTDIENAPDLAEILPALLEALTGRVVVVHFRNIERAFLDGAVQARLGESLLFPVIDTMALEARRHRESLWSRWRRWFGRPPASIRLNDSRARYGLPAYHGHHALRDALATAELFQAQVAHVHGPQTPIGRLWC